MLPILSSNLRNTLPLEIGGLRHLLKKPGLEEVERAEKRTSGAITVIASKPTRGAQARHRMPLVRCAKPLTDALLGAINDEFQNYTYSLIQYATQGFGSFHSG